MNNQTFFLIIIILVLVYYLPGKNNLNEKYKSQYSQPTQTSQTSQPYQPIQTSQTSQTSQPTQTSQTSQTQMPSNSNISLSNIDSQNIINEYLNENECKIKENFNTMGMDVNIGNDMAFTQQILPNPSPLSKSLSKSMVPDFEPSYLNINPDLNLYGYATTNPEASEYYKARGFMNPEDGVKFADSVSHMLSHPYQTRYCEKQN